MDCVTVYGEWQGVPDIEVHAKRCELRIVDPVPVYLYRQNGRTKISRRPLYQIEWTANDGTWRGWASTVDLRRAGVVCSVRATVSD